MLWDLQLYTIDSLLVYVEVWTFDTSDLKQTLTRRNACCVVNRANHFDDRDIHAFLQQNYPHDTDACMLCDRLVQNERFHGGTPGGGLGDVVMYT